MIALIDKYFPDLTRPQRGQFEALYALYADWNTKINVISQIGRASCRERVSSPV